MKRKRVTYQFHEKPKIAWEKNPVCCVVKIQDRNQLNPQPASV